MKKHLTCMLIAILTMVLLASTSRASAQDPDPAIGDAVSQPASTPSTFEPMFSGCTPIHVAPANDAYEQRVVELVNIERAKYSQPPLKRYSELDYAARYHAFDMVQDSYFKHDSYDRDAQGNLVLVCDTWARIANFYSGHGWRGENIAAGQTTPEIVMNSWINSPGHHDNMISANYNEVGVGFYSNIWVQDYGARDVYPVIINNEAYSTTATQVSLYQYGQGIWNEMCVHIDGGSCSWQAFQANFTANLTCSIGAHTVSVDLRKTGQTSAAVSNSDTILLTVPSLGSLPEKITFLYDQNQAKLYPSAQTLQPLNTTGSQVLNWNAVKTGFTPDWLNLDLSSGSTPGSKLTLTPTNAGSIFDFSGSYTGTLTFTASGAACIGNNPLTIPARLVVAEDVKSIYLPSVLR
jgi:uncharacterized protein YkwD